MKKTISILLLSSFNVNNLKDLLLLKNDVFHYEVTIGPYKQVLELIMDSGNALWEKKYDVIFIWTLPQNILHSFQKLINGEESEAETLYDEVDLFSEKIITFAKKNNNVLIASWVYNEFSKNYNLHNFRGKNAVNFALVKANYYLATKLEQQEDIFILDANIWLDPIKNRDEKLWYYTKTPFNFKIFNQAANGINSAIEGIYSAGKKLLITDLDDTIWAGIVGDEGYENIKVGGHDALGEMYFDVQKLFKFWKKNGIILAIISKNDSKVIQETFSKRTDMPLKLEDFSCIKINWEDKAKNMEEILKTLNLPPSSAIFIDDNESERERIRESFPDVLIFDFPKDNINLYSCLLDLNCFNSAKLLIEDVQKANLYQQESHRSEDKLNYTDLNEWLASLNIKISFANLNKSNIDRAIQLLNKTNQMNLSTRRLTKNELQNWLAENTAKFYCFFLEDKFGNAGLIGLCSFYKNEKIAIITDFVLSCRVFSRRAEEAMLHVVSESAKNLGCTELKAIYKPTEKNLPCLNYFKNSSFIAINNNFSFTLENTYPVPSYISIEKINENELE